MELPVLGKIPSAHNEQPIIKLSSSGVTYLRGREYKKRYVGSKAHAVDINGKFWVKAKDLEKDIKAAKGEAPRKKKLPVKNNQELQKFNTEMQISGNLSTLEHTTAGDSVKLSTKKERFYTIHKREVRQRILGYMNSQRGSKELYFWTITFPAKTQDLIAYRAFNTWLTTLRQYKMLKEYIWIAERQPQTDTIHFHIAIPHKMYVPRANQFMRGTLRTLAKQGLMPVSHLSPQIRKYNGVDICKNRSTKRVINFAVKKGSRALAGYLTKYVTKNEGSFTHLAWHNSRGYSAIFTGITFTLQEFKDLKFGFFMNRTKRFDAEHFTFIPWISDPPPVWEKHLFQLNSYIQNLN